MQEYTSVIGAFNCQGGETRRNECTFQFSHMVLSKPAENTEISLEPFNFELITVSPVTVLARKSIHFPYQTKVENTDLWVRVPKVL